MVVVKDISRFARNTVDLLESTRKLKSYGIETTFLTANMTVLGQSEFVLTIFGALAQEERANTSKRVKFGKKLNAEKGRVPNIVYGYDKTKGDYFNLTINPIESAVVQRMFDLYVNQGYGANKIAQILNNEGIKTKRNCKWSQAGVSGILTNPIYMGTVVNGKEEVKDFLTSKRIKTEQDQWYIVDNPALRIVSEETFHKAAEILANRANAFHFKHERHSNRHLFSTLIKCKCCGYSFRRTERAYQNVYIKWVCSKRNANGKDACPNHSKIDEGLLKTAIQDYFISVLSQKEVVIAQIVREFHCIYHTKEENVNQEQTLMLRLAKAQKSRQKHLDMYEDELITREELREKVAELNREAQTCQSELNLIQRNINKGDQLEQVLSTTFASLESVLDMDAMTNAQLKQLVDKITVDETGKIDVYLKLLSDIGLEQTVLIAQDRT